MQGFMEFETEDTWDALGSSDVQMKIRILRAVDKPLDSTNITEICKNAGISRKTFYRHFKSKFDIPRWHLTFCQCFYLNEVGRTIDWRTGYFHHLRLLAKEREFYQKAIRCSINDPFGQTSVWKERAALMLNTLKNYRHVEIDANMKFIVETFAKLEGEIICSWLRSSRPVDLAKWADDLASMVPPRLYEALEIDGLKMDFASRRAGVEDKPLRIRPDMRRMTTGKVPAEAARYSMLV